MWGSVPCFRGGPESTWEESKHENSDGEDYEEKDSLKVRRSGFAE